MAGLKPLRIAMLSLHSSPIGPLGAQNTGGMSIYVREAAKWMGASGHRVDVYTYAQGPAKAVDLYPNVRLVDLNPEGRHKISKETLFNHLPDAALALERHAEAARMKYHIIHSHYWLSGVAAAMVQKKWGCPHLTMFHTLGKIKNTTTEGESEPDRRIDHERRLVDETHGIVVPTRGERKNLETHLGAKPEKVFVIPCGVNMNRFKPMEKKSARSRLKIDSDSLVLLYVGRFAPVKGIETLLAAVAELVPRFPQMKLVVVGGDGPDASTTLALKDRAARLGISSHLCLAGRIEHDALPLYYNAAEMLVLPSHYESFGLVTLEALACGTPVAATNTGGAPSVIQEGFNGTLIHQPVSHSVSRGIVRLFNQSQLKTASSDQIRGSVSGYGWDRVAASMVKVYYSLLG